MAIEVNGKSLELTETGFLANVTDWNEDVARAFAAEAGVELTDKHWDVMNYLREEYFNNNQNQPNDRSMLKAMSEKWGYKVASKELYDLFPGKPSKQAGQFAGLPESRRKGGY